MFDTFNGLPLHPLVVHAVVVLLPLAAIGTIVIAVAPRFRPRYGLLVVAAAALSTALIPVATSSGEALERRVGDPGVHAELGGQLIWFAVPLLLSAAALVWLDRRDNRNADMPAAAPSHDRHDDRVASTARSAGQSSLVLAVAGVAVVAALATSVQIYRVGDSGARAAWGDTPSSSSSHGGGE